MVLTTTGMVFNSQQWQILLFSTASRLALGPTLSPIQWVRVALSPGMEQLGNETDHSPPISADVFKGRYFSFSE
jgi:hypothetical protein